MEYTKSKDRFYLDGHIHMPIERIEDTLSLAIERGLNALVFADYGSTFTFDCLTKNKDENGEQILNPKNWDIKKRNHYLLEMFAEKGNIYVIKGEEVKAKQGHLLLWAIKEPIDYGADVEYVLREAYKQDGLAIFPHLLATFFHGCDLYIFKEMYKKFKGQPIGLEQNGQIPDFISANKDVKKLAEKYGLACFGNSDIHGHYLKEHKKIGLRLHSSVDRKHIDLENMVESLRDIMLNNYDKIQTHGNTNTFKEIFLWNCASLKKNKGAKLKDLANGFIRSMKK